MIGYSCNLNLFIHCSGALQNGKESHLVCTIKMEPGEIFSLCVLSGVIILNFFLHIIDIQLFAYRSSVMFIVTLHAMLSNFFCNTQPMEGSDVDIMVPVDFTVYSSM